jgi:hypothetical protein
VICVGSGWESYFSKQKCVVEKRGCGETRKTKVVHGWRALLPRRTQNQHQILQGAPCWTSYIKHLTKLNCAHFLISFTLLSLELNRRRSTQRVTESITYGCRCSAAPDFKRVGATADLKSLVVLRQVSKNKVEKSCSSSLTSAHCIFSHWIGFPKWEIKPWPLVSVVVLPQPLPLQNGHVKCPNASCNQIAC